MIRSGFDLAAGKVAIQNACMLGFDYTTDIGEMRKRQNEVEFCFDGDADHRMQEFTALPSSLSPSPAPASSADWNFQQTANRQEPDETLNVDPIDMDDLWFDNVTESDYVWDASEIFSSMKNQEQSTAHPPQASTESKDMSALFLEWLKTNRESVCLADLRKIKLKRATVECAVRRLGGGTEGTRRLLQLVLLWIQQHRLRSSRGKKTEFELHYHDVNISSPCITSPSCDDDPPPPSSLFTFSDATSAGVCRPEYTGTLPSPSPPVTPAELPYPWNFSSFSDRNPVPASHPVTIEFACCSRKPCPFSDGDTPAVSATKEARKKRMARQRRTFAHQSRKRRDSSSPVDKQGTAVDESNAAADTPPQVQNRRRELSSSDDEHWKPEKNMRFLLQKVLKQSDVGSLGRIVLPKKEAELYLPDVDSRDGVLIAMEDIGTSRVWNMRYRFWPNNKSKMHVLENTGDFIRLNGLREGDFIVIYSDEKSGKHLLRGVKVRQQDLGSETSRTKSQRILQSTWTAP